MCEWKELKTLQQLAEAQKNGDEVQVAGIKDGRYVAWCETEWEKHYFYRSRPKKKVKQIIVISALIEESFVVTGTEEWITKVYLNYRHKVKWLLNSKQTIEVES